MNILLTGGSGFIGTNLQVYLRKIAKLYAPKSSELNLLNKNQVISFIRNNSINFIIHCAACGVRITHEATLDTVALPNIKMFENLVEASNYRIPIIVIGSGAEYNKARNLHKVHESEFGSSIPKDPYGYSKYIISKNIEKYDNILNLRVFGVYGFFENQTRVTTSIIKNNLRHEPIMLNQNVVFDFIWVSDLCKIIVFFVENGFNKKFINVSPSKSIEIKELAEIVNDFSDYTSDIIIKNTGTGLEYTGDNSILMQSLNDFSFTSYYDGMRYLYSFIKNNNFIR